MITKMQNLNQKERLKLAFFNNNYKILIFLYKKVIKKYNFINFY